MTHCEQELANTVMNELSDSLVSLVRKIKDPTEVVWGAIVSALIASAFFWGGAEPTALGLAVGLPAILAICVGVGGCSLCYPRSGWNSLYIQDVGRS